MSPSSTFQDAANSRPEALFGHALKIIPSLDLTDLHIVEPGISGSFTEFCPAIDSAWLRQRYSVNLIAAGITITQPQPRSAVQCSLVAIS